MNLVIFDIDGTLTNTSEVDSDCFTRAFREVHGIELIDTDWSNYVEATDPGLSIEVFKRRFGRPPDAGELRSLKARFVRLLAEGARRSPLLFSQIPGASSAIRLLRSDPACRVAIATGSWKKSALIKLATAGIEIKPIPAAFAEDSISRVGILRKAIERAAEDSDGASFEKVIYIGDGQWDLRAAAELKISFVGISSGSTLPKDRLQMLDNYTDHKRLLYCLTHAEVPVWRV